MNLSQKIINIVTSIRFIQLLIVAFLQSLVVLEIIDSVQGEALTQIVQFLLIGSTALGTADSLVTKASATVVVESPAAADLTAEEVELLNNLK